MNAALLIEKMNDKSDVPYEILKLADPSRQQIDTYLDTGICFIAKVDFQTVGTIVLNEIDESTIEIKNIAVVKVHRGKGYGKQLLRFAEKYGLGNKYQKLLIGTGNSSLDQLALYQKVGFDMVRIDKDFFIKHYPRPIFENGIQCKHMVILEKILA